MIKKLEKEIWNTKVKLIAKAKNRGLYENFGQKEFDKLCDKYNYNDLVYGTLDERMMATQLDDFFEWCVNYNG